MSANTQKSFDKSKARCDFNEFARVRYVHGMLLDDQAFQAEQKYHVGKRKFLNRMLHGSGVVCGLGVRGEKGGQTIEVSPGFALDCSGNEIWVSHSEKIDLASLIPPKAKPKEAECEEKVPDKPGEYYIGIRYDEKGTNPVSIYLPSGGCDERTCENSRYKEGYCIQVVDCCIRPRNEAGSQGRGLLDVLNGSLVLKPRPAQEHPDATCDHCKDLQGDKLERCLELERRCEQSVPCPECCSCDSACSVVLGKITVDDNLRLQTVCLNECRKYVLTPHLLRHLLLGMTDPDDNQRADEFINNPIGALCEFLQYIVVKDGKVPVPNWLDLEERIRQLETKAGAPAAPNQPAPAGGGENPGV
jgi:hypothetical protein